MIEDAYIEPGSRRHTLTNGTPICEKDGRYYDVEGNHLPAYAIRGRLLGGPCGQPTCLCIGACWQDTSREGHPLLCRACAEEKNSRAEMMFGRDYAPPCVPVPA
jgi:hypothetical protein